MKLILSLLIRVMTYTTASHLRRRNHRDCKHLLLSTLWRFIMWKRGTILSLSLYSSSSLVRETFPSTAIIIKNRTMLTSRSIKSRVLCEKCDRDLFPRDEMRRKSCTKGVIDISSTAISQLSCDTNLIPDGVGFIFIWVRCSSHVYSQNKYGSHIFFVYIRHIEKFVKWK